MSDLLRIATEPVTTAAVASGVAGAETRRLSGADPREARSTRDPIRFGALLGQLDPSPFPGDARIRRM